MSRKKILGSILFISLLAIALPIALFLWNRLDPPHKNEFTRRFKLVEKTLSSDSTIDLGFEGYYISGHTKRNLFLSHRNAPAHILMVDSTFRDTTHFNLKLEVSTKNSQLDIERLRVSIDSPKVYMEDGPGGVLLQGDLFCDTLHQTKFNNFSYVNFYGLSNGTYLFKTVNPEEGHSDLVIQNARGETFADFKLDKQIDGIFCCDGMLLYDKITTNVFHIFYYRNQIICLDTLLKKRYSSKSIDTISRAQIELADINMGRDRTFGSIPTKVNRRSCIYNSFLYINSSIKADNESDKLFKENSVVDVYNGTKGTYLYSFYLPKYQNKELRYFQVIGQTVFVLYKRHLITYKLSS